MIVADTNLIAYLFINGESSELAERTFARDPRWAAPLLWRSEFRSVLLKGLRDGHFGIDDAVRIAKAAADLMAGSEYSVGMGSRDVLMIAAGTPGCSAYDAEFVALARELDVPLVTADARLQKTFPGTVVPLARFAAG